MKNVIALVLCLLCSVASVQAQESSAETSLLQEFLAKLPTLSLDSPSLPLKEKKEPKRVTPAFFAVWGGLTTAMLVDTHSTEWSRRCCPTCQESTPGVRAFVGRPVLMALIGTGIDAGVMGISLLMARHWNPVVRRVRYFAPIGLTLLHVQAVFNNYGLC